MIADYAAFVVPGNSKYKSWKEVIADFKKDPLSVKVAGGSVKGSMDHLVPAMAIEAAGGDPLKLVYVPYDAGGKTKEWEQIRTTRGWQNLFKPGGGRTARAWPAAVSAGMIRTRETNDHERQER